MTNSPGARLNPRQRGLFVLIGLTLLLMAAYVSVRLITLFSANYSFADAAMAVLLLGAELFLCFHGIGYFLSVVKAQRRQQQTPPLLFAAYGGRRHSPATSAHAPAVAVLVASFNESADVLEETLASIRAMDYPAAHTYLLDDSTRAECRQGAARVAGIYGATLVHRTDRSGYKAGAINDLLPTLEEPYVALLDADQRPLQGWLKDLVPYMEAHPDLAFVQVPQVYVNGDGLPVAEAATYQQAVFFEYICEGKAYSNAMFCCGSNVILRRDALLSIGCTVKGRRHFFDETSVTEDFATSFRLHEKGWRTDYVNRPYVVGMGPETLPAYFTQQMRWAMGTMGVGLQIARRLTRTPRALAAAQWWEYLLSGSYYFVGLANFIFMMAPILFVLFDVRPMQTRPSLYLVFFLPYIVFTMNAFFFGMWLRRYSIRGIWLASALSFATFWIYMKAAIVALFGLKRAFGVTPKGVGGAIPVMSMLPELIMLISNAGVALWGGYHVVRDGWSIAYVMNTIWAAYHTILLSTLFVYFNKPVTIAERRLLFESRPLAA
jgi:cellulose synthase (UDP-forming)